MLRSFRARHVLGFALPLALAASHASGVLITFESFPGPDGQLGTADDVPVVTPTPMLTTEYASLGVVFLPIGEGHQSYQGKIIRSADDPPSDPTYNFLWGAVNSEHSGISTAIQAVFTVPVRTLSMRVKGSGGILVSGTGDDGLYHSSSVYLTNDVATFVTSYDITYFSVSPIDPPSSFGVGVDDLTFVPFPEPTTATLAMGVAGTLARRRRRCVG